MVVAAVVPSDIVAPEFWSVWPAVGIGGIAVVKGTAGASASAGRDGGAPAGIGTDAAPDWDVPVVGAMLLDCESPAAGAVVVDGNVMADAGIWVGVAVGAVA